MRSSIWHALGNTYRVVEPDGGNRLDSSRATELAAGTDGVLEILDTTPTTVDIAIWNPDGSLAELSGNGTRIAAAWLMELTGKDVARVHVGPRTVDVRRVGERLYESDMGAVEIHPREEVAGLEVTAVIVGNPHAVVVGDPDELPRIGPLLEGHPRYPNRTNVQVARVDAPGEVTARVWERGVGETTASGSSAVAVAAATHGKGDVLVHFPGGDLRVRLRDGRATLIGPAERVG